MKGVVFNLLEDVVTKNHGDAAWDKLLDAADVRGAYTSLGSYPDREMSQLVTAASSALGLSAAEVLQWFGRRAIPILAERYNIFFSPHEKTRPFLLSLNDIIHPEVHKLYPGAVCPMFQFRESDEGALLIGYHSPRRLCALAHGFIEGAAEHYFEPVDVRHLSCMHEGDKECLLRVAF